MPKAVDEYLSLIEKFHKQRKINYQILFGMFTMGNLLKEKIVMPFSMLLNLVGSSNTDDKKILWKFINRFHKDVNPKKNPILDHLTECAIKFFKDKLKPNKIYKKPNEKEKKALINLAENIEKINENTPPEEIQTMVYSVGKDNGYKENLRDWFKLIYQVLFGDVDGPRLGFFVSFFGVKETVKLIKDKII